MDTVARMCRRANRVLSDLAAARGRLEVVHRRWECDPEEYDALVSAFEAFGTVGGASARVHDRRGDLLLVRPADGDGWRDPGDGCRPGESFADCARRATRAETGLEADLEGVAEVTVLHASDWSDREAVPHLAVVYEARASGEPAPGAGVVEARWHAELPERLDYEELGEAAVGTP